MNELPDTHCPYCGDELPDDPHRYVKLSNGKKYHRSCADRGIEDIGRVAAEATQPSDAERFQFIAESKSGTIRLDGDSGNPKDFRFVAPHYIHWCEPEMPLRTAIDAAIRATHPT